MLATCPTHLILFVLITLIFTKQYKSWTYLLCNVLPACRVREVPLSVSLKLHSSFGGWGGTQSGMLGSTGVLGLSLSYSIITCLGSVRVYVTLNSGHLDF
jgi:hypothetical protein